MMAKKSKKALSDTEITSLCESEIRAASGGSESELSQSRADAMDRYMGEPYGDEVEGRSQITTREVLDTVEWIMPSMMRMFCDAENLVQYEPVGEEDEERAQQETDAAHHVFWQQNNGFLNLYTLVKDALLSKTGVLKVDWDDTPYEEREEYKGLQDAELVQLMNDPQMDREIEEYSIEEDGYHVVFTATRAEGRVTIEPCPPEEIGVSRDIRSPDIKQASFVFHRTKTSRSDLLERGYDSEQVDKIPSGYDWENQEQLSRSSLEDDQIGAAYDSSSQMAKVWITECYIYADRDGDGIDELLKVVLASGNSDYGSGSILLEIDEADRIPLVAFSPILVTHKFYGLSMADMVMDLQRIKTTLLRQMLDNLYQINNQRTAVNDLVNVEDVMTNRPGGVIRTEGDSPPLNNVQPMPTQALPPEAFGMMEYLDTLRQKRTGVGDEVSALDNKALANMNTGVAALAYDSARSKIELIARICAELALRPLFRDIHELLQKHSTRPMKLRLRGNWTEVNPSEWRRREDITVSIGLGRVSQERKLMGLSDVMEKQAAVVQGGGLGVLVTPEHMHNAVTDYTELLGLPASRYWMDPATAQPQQPKPDYQMMSLQVQSEMVKTQQAKVMSDGRRGELEMQIKAKEIQTREKESAIKLQIQQSESRIDELKMAMDMASDDHKRQLATEIAMREQQRADAELRLDASQAATKNEVEMYKALLQSGTTLTKEQLSLMGDGGLNGPIAESEKRLAAMLSETVQQLSNEMRGTVGEIGAALMEVRESQSAPKTIERDESGLILSVSGRPVQRDKNGRLVGV